MLLQTLLACGLAVACALLNRVRGGGLYGDLLPGRALLWVTPAIGLVAWVFNPWPIAIAFAGGYLLWGLPGWSYLLCRIAGIAPPRSASTLEAACCVAPGVIAPFFVRMLFVLPGVIAVAWLLGNWWFVLAAPAFAAAATAAYALLFRPIGMLDWPRAEFATGALWGLLILSPKVLTWML
jgi:hypothetical protein